MDLGQQRLQQLLLPGERVIWSGQPDPRAHFTPADFWLIPFSLLWGGFAIFWEVSAATSGAPTFFVLFGAVFVLIGLHFIVGRFFYKNFSKQGTIYALTDRRAIVLRRGMSLDEMAIEGARAAIWTSQFAGRMNVKFGAKPSAPVFNSMHEIYLNTGMDFLLRAEGGNVRFFDVADVAGLTAALSEFRLVKSL